MIGPLGDPPGIGGANTRSILRKLTQPSYIWNGASRRGFGRIFSRSFWRKGNIDPRRWPRFWQVVVCLGVVKAIVFGAVVLSTSPSELVFRMVRLLARFLPGT